MADLLPTVRRRLLERGVSRRRVERYIGELTDHLDDLTEALSDGGLAAAEARAAALVRLGDADALVEPMLSNRRLLAWPHRALRVAFVLAPALFHAVGVGLVIAWLVVTAAPAARTAPVMQPGVAVWVVPGLTITTLIAVAVRNRVAITWPLVGISLVILLVNATRLDLTASGGQAHALALSIGLPSVTAVAVQGGLAALGFLLFRRLRARSFHGMDE